MRFQTKPSFERSLKKLPSNRKEMVKEAVLTFAEFIHARKPPAPGLGLKLLHRPYWEIRSSLADRILFAWTGDLIEWLFVGDHDDIQRALKNFR